jgi:hypothetical protein
MPSIKAASPPVITHFLRPTRKVGGAIELDHEFGVLHAA